MLFVSLMIVLTQSLLAQSSREYLNQLPDDFKIKDECNKCPLGGLFSNKNARACEYMANLLKQNDPAKHQPVGLLDGLKRPTSTILIFNMIKGLSSDRPFLLTMLRAGVWDELLS